MFLLSRLAWCLLYIFGWKPLSTETLFVLKKVKQGVVVFPHTSIWDGMIFGLYSLAYPSEFKHSYALIARRYARYPFNYLLRKFRFVSVDNVNKGENQLQGLVDYFKNKPFLLFMSPKGTILNRPWRKGFYIIAQKIDCPIYVAGLCYLERVARMFPHQLFCTEILRPDQVFPTVPFNLEAPEAGTFSSITTFKQCILRHFATFHSLYPEREMLS